MPNHECQRFTQHNLAPGKQQRSGGNLPNTKIKGNETPQFRTPPNWLLQAITACTSGHGLREGTSGWR